MNEVERLRDQVRDLEDQLREALVRVDDLSGGDVDGKEKVILRLQLENSRLIDRVAALEKQAAARGGSFIGDDDDEE